VVAQSSSTRSRPSQAERRQGTGQLGSVPYPMRGCRSASPKTEPRWVFCEHLVSARPSPHPRLQPPRRVGGRVGASVGLWKGCGGEVQQPYFCLQIGFVDLHQPRCLHETQSAVTLKREVMCVAENRDLWYALAQIATGTSPTEQRILSLLLWRSSLPFATAERVEPG
jgi:hypothetical protein